MAGVFLNGAFSEGFDHTTVTTQIFTSGASGTISSGNARFVAQAGAVSQGWAAQSGNLDAQLALGVQLASLITGIAFKISALPVSGFLPIYKYYDSTAGLQCELVVMASGNLACYRSNTTQLALSTAIITPNSWYQVQNKITIGSSGLFEVRLSGNVTPVISFSGNTQNTANAFCDQVGIGGSPSGATIVTMDDWWMLDLTGAAPLNTYLGDKKIITLLPNNDSATGGLNVWSTQPSRAAGSHYLNVNEAVPDDATSYNFDSTPTDRESYRYPTIVQSAGVISFVNGKARLWKDDANSRSVAIVARSSGGVDTVGATFNMPSSPTYFANPFPNDPGTAVAWTIAGWNGGAEVGVEIIS